MSWMKDGMVPAWTLGELTPSHTMREATSDHHRDNGCDLHPSCLTCPLPACRYDLPPKRAAALMRDMQLCDLMADGNTMNECADLMGVSRRTVYRLKEYRAKTALVVVG